MKFACSTIVAGVLMLSIPGAGFAQQQQPAAPPAAATAAKAPATSDDAKKAKAKECSAQADAKSLHGKARKEFRSKCKRS
jgi:hypothetical protein